MPSLGRKKLAVTCEEPTGSHLSSQVCRKEILKSEPEISVSQKCRNLLTTRTMAKDKIGRQQKHTEGQSQYEDLALLPFHKLITRDSSDL